MIDRRPRRRDRGTLLWEDRYDASPFEQAFSVATRRDRVFVAGYVENSPGRDFVVRADDAATGILAWQDQLNKGDDSTPTMSCALMTPHRGHSSGRISSAASPGVYG